jgi:hypothetical protein
MTTTFQGPAIAPPAFAPNSTQRRILTLLDEETAGITCRDAVLRTGIPLSSVGAAVLGLEGANLVHRTVRQDRYRRVVLWLRGPAPAGSPVGRRPLPTPHLRQGRFVDAEAAADDLYKAMHRDRGWWGLPKVGLWAQANGIPKEDGRRYANLLSCEAMVRRSGDMDCPQWRVR